MEIALTKTTIGFIPADPETEEFARKIKPGEVIHSDFKRMRNYKFHKKYFALLKLGFENWSPKEINSKYGVPAKNFDRFRADVIILCGFYDNVVRLDGSVRIEPKSISFSKMSEDDFADLYSKTIDVFLKYIYDAKMTAEEIDELVNRFLLFA